jgi:uncharacterized protein (TIGR02597 family)
MQLSKDLSLQTIPNKKTQTKPKLVMKTYIPYSLLAAAAACGMALGQTAYTTPVGYVSLGKSTGDAVPASSDVHLSVPLDRATVHAGQIASISGSNVINLQGTSNLSSLTNVPHVVKITTGSVGGFYALITANDSSSITVSVPTGLSLSGVASGDKLEISEAWTATNFVAGNTIPGDTELYIYGGSDPGVNHAPSILLAWDGAQWLDQFSGEPSNPVLYPGEMLVVRTSSQPITSFVVSGQVPMSSFTNVLTHYGSSDEAQDLEMSIFSPVDQTLEQTGLISSARDSDELYVFDNSGVGVNQAPSSLYAFDAASGAYLDQFTGEPVPLSASFKSGTALIVRRAPIVAPAPVTSPWKFTPSYLQGN